MYFVGFVNPHSCLQDRLALSVSARYKAQWIGQNWKFWQDWAAELHLPPELFVVSKASASVKAKAGEQVPFSLPEWCLGTPMVLAQLARWSSTLRQPSRDLAASWLQSILEAALPCRELYMQVPSFAGQPKWPENATAFPESMNEESTKVIVKDCMVPLVALATHCPQLQHALKRRACLTCFLCEERMGC